MRNRLLFPALLVICVLIGCQQGTWKESSSPEGGFSILFPGTPTETTQKTDIADETIYMHIFLLEQKDFAYSVLYNDYPESVFQKKDTNRILDDMRNTFVSKGTLLKEDILSLDKYPGRDLRIKTSDGKYIMHDRIYLVKNRAYQIMAVTENESGFSEEDLGKFLESFKLL